MTSPGVLQDAELVAASLAGDRDAFAHIVARYQALVCSLAYSATGSLTHSEDLAQETFVAAWKQLATLREPAKLRAWLCSIARNHILNWLRKQGREPSHAADTLDAAQESPAPAPQPHDQTISNEEQAILWRSLERIPELYREPLVLFYREHQSVAAVAERLDLTETNVQQRLSRGRKLLAEEVAAFVEGALSRTAPGKAFTLGVLAALPVSMATSAKAATVALATAKSGASATGASFLSVLGVLAGPALGILGGYLGVKASLDQACTPRERQFILRHAWVTFWGVIVFVVALLTFIRFCGPMWKTHPTLFLNLGFALTVGYGAFIFAVAWRFNRRYAELRATERQLHPEAFQQAPPTAVKEYRSQATLLGLPLIHCRSGRNPGESTRPAVGWIACGDKAYGILFASGGVAVGGISFGGLSVGLFSFGGFSLGLVALGGVAVGGLALGGAALGLLASGGIAVAWHAAIGGVATAHEIALGGATNALHANDAVAREFFTRHHWLDITDAGPRNLFWVACTLPVAIQAIIQGWWRRRMARRRAQPAEH